MSTLSMDVAPTEVGVIVNPNTRMLRERPGIVDALRELLPASCPIVTTDRAEDARAAVAELVDLGIKVIAVAGGDGTLASLITAWFALTAGDPHPSSPAFLALRAGAWNRVASAQGMRGTPRRILARAMAAIRGGRVDFVEQPTLRVASSLRPAPDYGFTAMFGALYDLVEDAQRLGGARQHVMRATARAVRNVLKPDTAAPPTRLAANIDGVATIIGLAHATTLERDPSASAGFQLSTGQGATLGELRNLAATSSWTRVVPGVRTQQVIFDLDNGYVLDGDLHPASSSYVVRIDVGPAARLLTV